MATLTQRHMGIVREYDRTRGLGIIEMETGERAFVRYSAILGEGVRVLHSGDRVAFDLEHGPRGPMAVHVIRC
jgi:CspA family cold shock protein